MIDRFIEALQEMGLVLKDQDTTVLGEAQSLLRDEDIADVLWLTSWMGDEVSVEASSGEGDETSADVSSETIRAEDIEGDAAPLPPPPVVPAYMPNADQGADSEEERPEPGLPLQVQTASALPNELGIGRSLRPFMRKVPSRTQQQLDEIATVNRIAEEDIWIPVMQAARERWFNLELVVEATPLSFVWESTLVELQQLLERQGAFRNVRTWCVEEDEAGAPRLRSKNKGRVSLLSQEYSGETESLPFSEPIRRSHLELIESSGRALVLYVSDCRSTLWRSGAIHDWLRLWSIHEPTVVAQLLPERLWSQTELKVGFKVQVSSTTPGVSNAKLQVYNAPSRRRSVDSQVVTLPIITLTAGALQQWAQVVSAAGQQRLPARLFDINWVKNNKRAAKTDWSLMEPQTPEARVELFNATASAPAQRLARLMSVVPVELPVAHLLQQCFFKGVAEPVHIAEVYDSCLLERKQTSEKDEGVHYEFFPEVRELLNRLNSINETLDVLDVISQEIARTLDFQITSFTALLAPQVIGDDEKKSAVLPFAKITTQVLRRLGGRYEVLAEQVEIDALQAVTQRDIDISPFEETDIEIPPLRNLDFLAVEVIDVGAADTEDAEIPVQLTIDQFNTASLVVDFEEPVSDASSELEIIRIFLAHAGEDRAAVTQLYQRLKESGFQPWLDVVDLLPGQSWRAEILKAIKNCHVFIACLSQTSVSKRGYAQTEFKMALNKYGEMRPGAFYLIPLRLDDCEIPDLRQEEYGVNLRDIQWVDFFEPDGFEQLVDAIEFAFPEAPWTTSDTEVEESMPQPRMIDLGNGVPLELIYIPGGTFLMGSPEGEGGDSERPQHEVTVPEFWMGKYPVTQAQYEVATSDNPSYFKGNERPVERVTWHQAVKFCEKISQQTGESFRLPSEAEWEYACRAGTTTRYYFDDNLTEQQACYGKSNSEGTAPVGNYPANAFGLYDMHGNVLEWCQDHWHENYDGAPEDASAWDEGGDSKYRVLRGGSWNTYPRDCRSAYRLGLYPDFDSGGIGFRVVCGAPRTLQT